MAFGMCCSRPMGLEFGICLLVFSDFSGSSLHKQGSTGDIIP